MCPQVKRFSRTWPDLTHAPHCMLLPREEGTNRKKLGLLPESQGHALVLTVLHMPRSLHSGPQASTKLLTWADLSQSGPSPGLFGGGPVYPEGGADFRRATAMQVPCSVNLARSCGFWEDLPCETQVPPPANLFPRCRANMAHSRQSRPDSGCGFGLNSS